MKKIFVTMIALGAFVPMAAMADVGLKCGDLNPANGTVVQCANGNPETVVSVWGMMNSQLPHIAPGASVTDYRGRVFTCPAWFTVYCVDLTHTPWFLSRF